MAGPSRQKRIDRGQAAKYLRVGESLLTSAEALAEIAVDGDPYGNAIGVIATHAAIAFNDALTIAYRGVKSTEGDHRRAADVLQQALGPRAPADQLTRLRSVLGLKDRISYSGTYYRLEEALRILGDVREFGRWARETYAQRP
jgi:hypothetical protein